MMGRERNLQGGTCTAQRVVYAYCRPQRHKNDLFVHRRAHTTRNWNKILVDFVPLPRKMGRRVRESRRAVAIIESARRTFFTCVYLIVVSSGKPDITRMWPLVKPE